MTDEPQVLLEEVSPHGNFQAVVEQDSRVCTFYLFQEGNVRPVWVRNLAPAPESTDRESMLAGRAPMQDARFCNHPEGSKPLVAEQLRVVWFDSGDGAALLENDDPIAIIPHWAGQSGFSGYARDCTGESVHAWPLTEMNALRKRIEDSERWWRQWDEDIWAPFQETMIHSLEVVFGPHTRYFSIDGGNWPPKALALFENEDSYTLLSIGVSIRPQPCTDRDEIRPEAPRRIELGISIDKKFGEDAVMKLGAYVSAQTNLPWTLNTCLGEGHSIPCDSMPNDCGVTYPAVLLTMTPPNCPCIALGDIDGEPIHLLWLIPVQAADRQAAEEQGTAVILDRLWGEGREVVFRGEG
ncbi:suppressor of fused domain protein [Novipirellula sp. SH528]|uniref:suppressor of fused domain protein n=1 Tax=Novipirellula sp. SH528 TaxID=3454466 RepID=UPI003FA07598